MMHLLCTQLVVTGFLKPKEGSWLGLPRTSSRTFCFVIITISHVNLLFFNQMTKGVLKVPR